MHNKHISAAASPISRSKVLLFDLHQKENKFESLQTQTRAARKKSKHKSMYQIALKVPFSRCWRKMIGETLMGSGENNSLTSVRDLSRRFTNDT